ncbi:MAG: ATP-binding protein [Thaumarchaeota archaeon]|nr:ATP-binding protein [Nitrososphaerota archaeon]|tara:strand:- start:875 stop:2017 length:1143 start_codon:yes stop_codon:yes gene_type:complete
MDPEIHMNIVELKMLREIKIDGNNIDVLIALTVAGCPLADTIKKDVKEELMKLEQVKEVSVETTVMTKEQLDELKEIVKNNRGEQQSQDELISRLDKKKNENLIAVVSGKGGVGKSSMTAILASELKRSGYNVGILDADVTGPSIAKIFGVTKRLMKGKNGIIPAETPSGLKLISVNLMLDNPEVPTVWRGPIVNNLIRQLYTDVDWGDIDYLLIDLPPGTGDAPLTVFQSLPLSGIVLVSTPQDLSKMIVSKSANMAGMLKIPLLGLVENMSYLECKHCGDKNYILGESRGEAFAEHLGTKLLARLPFEKDIAELCDQGKIEAYQNNDITNTIEIIKQTIEEQKEKSSIATIVESAGGNLSPAWNKNEEQKKKFKLTPV